MLEDRLKALVQEAPYNSERRNILRQILGEFKSAGKKINEQNFLDGLLRSNKSVKRSDSRLDLENHILVQLGAK